MTLKFRYSKKGHIILIFFSNFGAFSENRSFLNILHLIYWSLIFRFGIFGYFGPFFQKKKCLISMKIHQRFLDIKDETKGKNHPPQTFQPPVYIFFLEAQILRNFGWGMCPGYVIKNADICIPETPPPLKSANVCNWVPPPPSKLRTSFVDGP